VAIVEFKSFTASQGLGASRTSMSQQSTGRENQHSKWSSWYLLFVIQFIAVLWPPFYNSAEPSWAGIPFFYWYQLLWVIIGAILTAIVYFATED
jgi:Protein of unknown function (DUF3311)